MKRIGAIVVFYQPTPSLTKEVLEHISSQVEEICIVDNSPEPQGVIDTTLPNLHYIALKENRGIAAAQNIGIEYFKERGFDYIIFCDQDTIMPSDTVAKLLDTSLYLENKNYRVGSVCAVAIESHTGKPYTYNIAFIKDVPNNDGRHIMQVIHTMSSMSLVKLELFEDVGGMDESLFIDGVDSEWCWRGAQKAGLSFFYDKDIVVNHQLGSITNSVGNHTLHIATPFRIYYQYRNYIWFLRRDYIPPRWMRINGVKYFVKIFYYTIFCNNRRLYLKNIFRGIRDGIMT